MKKFCAVALVGNPNTGKSSFLNAFLQQELSAVTPKPQTTRKRIEGLKTEGDEQYLLFDAPGFVPEEKGLFTALSHEAKDTMRDADVILAFLGMDERTSHNIRATLQIVQKANRPWAAVITKTDLKKFAPRKEAVRVMAREMGAMDIFEFSKMKRDRIPETSQKVQEFLKSKAHDVEEFPYDADIISRQNVRDLVPEWIREQLFLQLGGEIPFRMAVQLRDFQEGPRLQRIEADLWVTKESHKPMVVGRGGAKIKSIGIGARKRLENFFGTQVHVGLHVVVKERWDLHKRCLQELGLHKDEKGRDRR